MFSQAHHLQRGFVPASDLSFLAFSSLALVTSALVLARPFRSHRCVMVFFSFFYIHVLDNNSNVTRIERGPQTFTRQEHEKLVAGPEPMIMIPPRHYCIIQNPVQRYATRRLCCCFSSLSLALRRAYLQWPSLACTFVAFIFGFSHN